MNTDKSLHNRILETLLSIANGQLNGLKCPRCGTTNFKYFFTKSDEDRYGVWLECNECEENSHADFIGKPKGFDPNLLNEYYQDLDDLAKRDTEKLKRKK
jgi:hypothetical protein